MTGQWQQNRDGAWYASPTLSADGTFHSALNAIEVGSIRARGGALTSAQLHAFLVDTRHAFQASKIDLALTRELRAALEACARDGKITWEVIQNPLSQSARILAIA